MTTFFFNLIKMWSFSYALPMNDKEETRLTVQTNIQWNRIKPPVWQIFSTTFHDTYQCSVSASSKQNINIWLNNYGNIPVYAFKIAIPEVLASHFQSKRIFEVIDNATENRPSVLKHSHTHCRYCTIVTNMSRGRLT